MPLNERYVTGPLKSTMGCEYVPNHETTWFMGPREMLSQEVAGRENDRVLTKYYLEDQQ
jgi:hypothetical protein